MTAEKIVTVFGSSRPKAGDAEYEEARELGKLLAKLRVRRVQRRGFGGGDGGRFRAAQKEGGGKNLRRDRGIFQAQGQWRGWNTEVRMDTWDARLFELIRTGGWVCGMQRRNGNAGGTSRGLGDAETNR